mgnify:CR=1 FL=1
MPSPLPLPGINKPYLIAEIGKSEPRDTYQQQSSSSPPVVCKVNTVDFFTDSACKNSRFGPTSDLKT